MATKTSGLTKEEAIHFVSTVMQKIFAEHHIELIPEFYSSEVIGHYGEEIFHIEDIKHRALALKENVKNFSFEIEDLCLIDDFIVLQIKQNWLNQSDDQYNESTLSVVYRIQDKKVSEVWMLTDRKLASYKEVNLNFNKEMHAFELNEKTKTDFLKRLKAIQKTTPNTDIMLSKSEEECLYYYFHGFSSKETAIQMNLSFRTIESYIARIKERFGCSTKIELRKYLFSHLAKK